MEVKPGYKQTEIGVIPEDWEIVPLSSCCDVRDGTHESPKYHSNGIPLVTSKNIVDGKLDLKDVSFISELDADMIDARSKVDTGDLLLSMIGTVGNVTKVDVADRFCIKNVALIKPRQVTGDYLLHLLRSDYFSMTIQSKLAGGIQKFISLGMLRSLYISIMSDHEQNKISETLSDIDLLITTLEKLIEKKKLIKKGVMQELLTGKRRLPGFLGEWEAKRLGDLCQIMKGSGLSKSSLNEDGSSYCILYGELFTKYNELIENPISKTEINQGLRSQKGDVLLPGSTTTTGIDLAKASALMTVNVLIGGDINVLRPLAGIYGPYLALQINTLLKHKIAEKTKGITIYHLHGKDLSDIDVRVPFFKEQVQISLVINALENEIAILQSKRKKHLLLKQAMMQELLTGRIRLV